MGRRVFISYSRRDRAKVRVLADGLTRSGFDVWMDGRLDGGQDWWDEILARIRDCQFFVFAISSASLESAACQSEYQYAVALERGLLPVEVGPVASERLFDERLGRTHRVPFEPDDPSSILDVVRSLLGLADPPPTPDGVATPDLPISYLGRLRNTINRSKDLTYDEQRSVASQLIDEFAKPGQQDEIHRLASAMLQRRDVLYSVAEHLRERIIVPYASTSAEEREAAIDDRPSVESSLGAAAPTGTERTPAGVVGEGGPASQEAPPHVEGVAAASTEPTASSDVQPRAEVAEASEMSDIRPSGAIFVSGVAIVAAAVYGVGSLLHPIRSQYSSGFESHFAIARVLLAVTVSLPGVLMLRGRRAGWRDAAAAAVGAALVILTLDLLQFVDGYVALADRGAATWAPSVVLRLGSIPLLLAVVVAAALVLWRGAPRSTRSYGIVLSGLVVIANAVVGLVIVASDRLAFRWVEPLYVVVFEDETSPRRVSAIIAVVVATACTLTLLGQARAGRVAGLTAAAAFMAGSALLFGFEAAFAPAQDELCADEGCIQRGAPGAWYAASAGLCVLGCWILVRSRRSSDRPPDGDR